MATKPSIPKGTRDFGPQEMLRRKYIFNTIEKVFRKFGYLPLETPAMEHLETLTGKYGEEGDRLIFKVLKRGADLERAVQDGSKSLAGEALRYDLTVPFARYVVQNQNEIAFPFKRYQIQPVWRADRPQKGRYREFYQCDADVIGSTSLLNEVELVDIISEVFDSLRTQVITKINSRKVLMGFAEVTGQPDMMLALAMGLDKIEKVELGIVLAELASKGLNERGLGLVRELHETFRATDLQEGHLITRLRDLFASSAIGQQGLDEIEFIKGHRAQHMVFRNSIQFDPTLARGLDYYTGAIFEVKAAEGSLQSSICGGGRYDDLTGVFGLKGMSGVGISFGADRIYDVLLETNKFPAELGSSTKLLFANFGGAEALHCLKLLRQVREAGIAAELYPDAVKMARQFKYADDKDIPFVAIIGGNEMQQGIVTIKDMKSGEQRAVKQDEIVAAIVDRT